MIYQETFSQLYKLLTGDNPAKARRAYDCKRLNRVLSALKMQNYFLYLTFTNRSGAAGVQGVSVTAPLRQRLILRGGSYNARRPNNAADPLIGTCDLQLFRSANSRPQLSRGAILDGHYVGGGQGLGQKWELDWPVPLTLDPNEVIKATFTQGSPTTAGTQYNLGLYGITVDNSFRCESTLCDEFRDQIERTLQRPFYMNLKNDRSAGTFAFPAIGANQRIVAQTSEAPEHLLILGFRRNSRTFLTGAIRLLITGDYSFSRNEIPINAFEDFTNELDGYFRFTTPIVLLKGSSIGLAITQTTTTVQDQFEGEINLLCVSI